MKKSQATTLGYDEKNPRKSVSIDKLENQNGGRFFLDDIAEEMKSVYGFSYNGNDRQDNIAEALQKFILDK